MNELLNSNKSMYVGQLCYECIISNIRKNK